MTARINRVGGGVAELVERVPDADLSGCLYFLAIAVLSTADLEDSPELSAALDEFRERDSVSATMRLQVTALLTQYEQRAFAAGRRGELDARDRAFFQARALNCVAHVLGADPVAGSSVAARDRLREAAYEGVVALRETKRLASVLEMFAG